MGLTHSRKRNAQRNISNFIVIQDTSSSKLNYLKNNSRTRYLRTSQILEQSSCVSPVNLSEQYTRDNSHRFSGHKKITCSNNSSRVSSSEDFKVELGNGKITLSELELLKKLNNYSGASSRREKEVTNIYSRKPINYQFFTAIDCTDSEEPHTLIPRNKSQHSNRITIPKSFNNGKPTYTVPAIHKNILQSPIRRFLSKLIPRNIFFKKQPSEHFLPNDEDASEGDNAKKATKTEQEESEDSLEVTLHSKTLEDSDVSLHCGSYSNRSLAIISSASYHILSTPVTTKNPQLQLDNLQIQHITTNKIAKIHETKSNNKPTSNEKHASYRKQVEKEFIVSGENDFNSLLHFLNLPQSRSSLAPKLIITPEHSHKVTQTHVCQTVVVDKSTDPNTKIIRMLEAKYKKNFKSLNELLQMPPKKQILFITKGTAEETTRLTVRPTEASFSYEQFLKTFRSGV